LEKDDPRLAKLRLVTTTSPGSAVVSVADRISTEEEAIGVLTNKIAYLQENMKAVHSDVTNLDALTPAIRDLQREVDTRESYYKSYLNTLERKRIEDDINGGGKNANIQVTQLPSPPSRERSKTPKMMGMAALAGILAGLGWAFFVELCLDHSVRRPKEIEGSLGLRLFLSIPDVNSNGHRRLGMGLSRKDTERGKAAKPAALLPEAAAAAAAATTAPAAPSSKLDVAPWDRSHSLHLYYEALRDRLISYFEINNLNHKPKLVAVTGSAQGSGTTTIAAGLAASLSETGDGNVLLIDMNLEHGATQEFYNGKPSCELDVALANETRDSAMVQNNLYVVSGRANGDQLSRMLPKRFANLLPKLKASDYDYIIFDMPPIGRTGVTQRLAGFMDMMLLVVEAEKTSRDVVKQASGLLTESKANVSVVLNKTRTYIPKRFHQEF
jgi:Mrp family chromosome partitioning ATPase